MAELSRARIESEHFVARYAQGRLGEKDSEAFEEFCLMNPEFAEQVAVDRVMLNGLRGLKPAPVKFPVGRPRWQRLALAASIAAALVLSIGFLVTRQSTPSPDRLYAMSTDLPASLLADKASSIRLVRARGGYVPEVNVSPSAVSLRIQAEPGRLGDSSGWSATLSEESDGQWIEIGRMPSVRADSAGMIELLVDVRQLGSSRLRLSLQQPGRGETENFEFRLTRAQP